MMSMEIDAMFEYDKKTIGKTIKRLRVSKPLSQEVLSSFAGIARSHLSMIENGTKSANFETICKIAFALDMNPYMLVKAIEDDYEAMAKSNDQKASVLPNSSI